MTESVIYILFGFFLFGILYYFFIRPKKGIEQDKIDLATKDAELKAGEEAKQELKNQLTKKEEQITKLYQSIENVSEYKKIATEAINKHDGAMTKYTNWWEKLTTNIQYQGKFNQVHLENILIQNGFTKDRDFIVQKKQSTYDVEGNKDKDVTPDIVLTLPQRNYVVDCKVSLTSWTKFVSEKDDKEKARYLKDHMDSVKRHINSLANKNYHKLYNLKSFQSVIMFFPAESLYKTTIKEDNELLTHALKSNIILASPDDFLKMIKLFEQIINENKQVENISKVIGSAEKIFDKYVDVKLAIKGALQTYRSHGTHLRNIVTKSWGSQGLEKQIKKLKDDHGVIPGKQIPEIPPEQTTIVNVDDPEEEEKVINLSPDKKNQ